MKPEEAFNALQKQELTHKSVEIGKVLLTWAILKNVDMVVQRVVFLHEELMKLPSFPRKALEADLDLYKGGEMGKELLGLDVLHKFMWVRLIARMFEAMAGNFAYSGDIHLFLNVLNGALILHSEDACILRYVIATYINAAHHFKNIFSTNGYLLIMPTLLQLYANHQINKLVTTTVEYAVKQFYLMNRKPFILQMFGSVSAILDTDEEKEYGDPHKVPSSCLFNLLLSLETPSPDPLAIAELVKEEQPLKAIDFCYHDENEMVTVLDCISLCVMVIAYAADSVRGHQMLTILEAILPCYLQHIQLPSYKKEGKTEKEIIHQLAVAMRTLVNNCEALAKNYNGPQRASPEHKGSSQRNYSRGPYSPGYDFEDESQSKYLSDHSRNKMTYERDLEDSEVLRNEFRRPRDTLLSMVAEFLTKSSARLAELNKKSSQEGKMVELLDIKSHVRLADVAHSLLKVAPYDPDTMMCRGLQRYMNEILPSTEWTNEAMRPALISILRRLDKTFSKIYKKPSIRRHTDWEAAAGLLKGVYETLSRYPYIVHMQHLKTLINTCQALIVGDATSSNVGECVSSATAALMSQVPPPHFCSIVVRLIALQILAIGESYSLEQVCGGSSVFPTQEKTENMLMNLLMPLCLRVGSGRKDAPRLRQVDISFMLTVVLHALSPPATKTAPVNTQNIKSTGETRTGSHSYSNRENKKTSKISASLYQVAYLALKIMIICFESELVTDWIRIARTVRELGQNNEGGLVFWNFLDFVVTQRTPLFVLLLPFLHQKVRQPSLSDQERHMQHIIREKLRGLNLPTPKGRGSLLMDLAHEVKELKEELDDNQYDDQRENRHTTGATDIPSAEPTTTSSHPGRSSLIADLLTGDLVGPRDGNNKNHNETIIVSNVIHHQTPRDSVSSMSAGESTTRAEPSDAATAADSSSGSHGGKTPAGETSMTPLSPGSPTEGSSGETSSRSTDKPRLQRSKAQSRKTFRLRKSRKSHIEVSHIKIEPREIPQVPGQSPTIEMPVLELSVSGIPPVPGNQPPPQLRRLSARLTREGSDGGKDTSWDEVSLTSSISGYRESYSALATAIESPSPDSGRRDMPSTSSAATTHIGSPDTSANSTGGEETALLCRSDRTLSQHSLLMVFETQDEDTLI